MEIEFNKQHKITNVHNSLDVFQKTKRDDDIKLLAAVIYTKHLDGYNDLVNIGKRSNIPADIEGLNRDVAAEEIYDDLVFFSKKFPEEKEIKNLINIMRPSIALMSKNSYGTVNSINEYKKAINQLTTNSPPLFIQGGWKSIDKFFGHNILYVIKAYDDSQGSKKLELKLINRGAGCHNHQIIEQRRLIFKEEARKKIIGGGLEPNNINDMQKVLELVKEGILDVEDLKGIKVEIDCKVQNYILNDIDPSEFLDDGWIEKLMSPISESQEIGSQVELTQKGIQGIYEPLRLMVENQLAKKVDSKKPGDVHSLQKTGTCSVRPLQGWISENVPRGTMRKFRLFSLEKDLGRLYKFFVVHKNIDKLFLELKENFPEIYEKIDKNIQSDIKKESNILLKLSKLIEVEKKVLFHQKTHIENRLQEAKSRWSTHPLAIFNSSNEYQKATGNLEPELDIGSILPTGAEEIRQFTKKVSSLVDMALSDKKNVDQQVAQISQEDLIDRATNEMDLISHVLYAGQVKLVQNL